MPGPVLPSVLDRLLDEHPEQKSERPEDWSLTVEQLEKYVLRDLNYLANSSRPEDSSVPPECKLVRESIWFYGLWRPGRLGKSAEDHESIRRELEQMIKRYEPRLAKVKVSGLTADSKETQHSIRHYAFTIQAVLRFDPMPDVCFDATMNRYPQGFRITGAVEQPSPAPAADEARAGNDE